MFSPLGRRPMRLEPIPSNSACLSRPKKHCLQLVHFVLSIFSALKDRWSVNLSLFVCLVLASDRADHRELVDGEDDV